MAEYAFRILNVFTRGQGAEARLTGNPLCVFEDGQGLSDRQMQALALQFNLSETTFILPSSAASARVRIFTPTYEMPFAGHPTLGTAHVVHALGEAGGDEVSLEMKAGIIPVARAESRWTLLANAPTWREVESSLDDLAALLGLEAGDIGERPLWVNAGKEQLMVPLKSAAAVRRAKPRPDAPRRPVSRDGHSMAYVFAPEEDAIVARFFFPQGAALIEDPATGSACANLGGWHLAMGHSARECDSLAITVLQGDQCGRPSTLYLNVDHGQVRVGGEVVELGRGHISL